MKAPEVSVIVPVYNVEKYIRRCLDSLKAQTFNDFEVILVDDGSPDRCGKICDEYASADPRFKVIHQQNGGVSVARQTGIDNATGEYTIHVDPDDWVAPTMLEALINKAEEENADMVICDHYIVSSSGLWEKQYNIPTPITSKELQRRMLNGTTIYLWDKLIRRSYYTGIGFYPKEMHYYEDKLFLFRVLNNSENIRIAYLPKLLYYYVIRKGSAANSYSDRRLIATCLFIPEFERVIDPALGWDRNQMKAEALFVCLVLKRFETMKTLYPEIHADIIAQPVLSLRGPKYPGGRELSLALRGFPKLAHNIIYVHNIIRRIRNNRNRRNR